MAPRANWKGFLRLSLVTCPVASYPATSDSEKISFNQINRNTGHRIKYLEVDADTGEEVASDEIMKGYEVDTDTYIEITKDRQHQARVCPKMKQTGSESRLRNAVCRQRRR
jgi:DNA end-binding protein Ku